MRVEKSIFSGVVVIRCLKKLGTMKQRILSVCSPPAERCSRGQAASHWGIAQTSPTLRLGGNLLHYHWGGGQTVQRLQEKTLSLQWFSPPTHSATSTTRRPRLAYSQRGPVSELVLTSKARRKY